MSGSFFLPGLETGPHLPILGSASQDLQGALAAALCPVPAQDTKQPLVGLLLLSRVLLSPLPCPTRQGLHCEGVGRSCRLCELQPVLERGQHGRICTADRLCCDSGPHTRPLAEPGRTRLVFLPHVVDGLGAHREAHDLACRKHI